jgi:hypothetical protein
MEPRLDELMDRLVGVFADRVAAGEDPRREELLAEVPPGHRAALERCFRMIETAPAQGLPRPLGPRSRASACAASSARAAWPRSGSPSRPT